MYKYPIIVFEGIEGSGKSYHIKNIQKYLDKNRIKYIKVREPGGSKNSEKIRKLILNKDSKFKNIRSTKLLKKVLNLIKLKGYEINNIDINVIAQKPKINIYRNKIINSISKLCNIYPKQINLKGKTTEKLGLIGKEKAIAAEVITSVSKYDE